MSMTDAQRSKAARAHYRKVRDNLQYHQARGAK